MKGPLSRLAGLFITCVMMASCSPKVAQQIVVPTKGKAQIQEIQVVPRADKTNVFVVSEEPMVYTAFHLSNPDRLVIDIVGVELGKFTEKIQIPDGPIRLIIPKMTEEGRMARLEMELAGAVQTNVRPEGVILAIEAVVAPEVVMETSKDEIGSKTSIREQGKMEEGVAVPVQKEGLKPAEICLLYTSPSPRD